MMEGVGAVEERMRVKEQEQVSGWIARLVALITQVSQGRAWTELLEFGRLGLALQGAAGTLWEVWRGLMALYLRQEREPGETREWFEGVVARMRLDVEAVRASTREVLVLWRGLDVLDGLATSLLGNSGGRAWVKEAMGEVERRGQVWVGEFVGWLGSPERDVGETLVWLERVESMAQSWLDEVVWPAVWSSEEE